MKKVLLIEDEDYSFWSISHLLIEIGYNAEQVMRCSCLGEAELVNAEDIEIVLTDLTLPDSVYPNTFEQVSKLFPYTPVIVLTGTAEIDVAINTIQHGAQDYLVKGEFDQKMLQKAMQYAIERKRFLHKIFIEKKKLQATINNTNDIIWSIDRQNKVISANQAFWERIYKITGKKQCDVHSGDFDRDLYDTWVKYYERAFKGEVYKIIWSETQNGAATYEEVSFNPILDKSKHVIGVSCFSRDITGQFNHLHMIEKQNEQLRKIAWVQSHEVRSPVATILGLANLLNENDPNDPHNTDILKHIKEAANNLDDVIKKITSYTYTSTN